MSNKPLPPQQQKIVDFIREFRRLNDFGPSNAEIASHLGLTAKGSIATQLRYLKEKGYITFVPGRARTANVVDDTPQPAETKTPSQPNIDRSKMPKDRGVPYGGPVSAGPPLEIFERPERIFKLTERWPPEDYFLLIAHGDSMSGCFDNGSLLVFKRDVPKNGDIVCAVIDNEELVKIYHEDDDEQITLYPANRSYPLIQRNVRDVQIYGVLESVMWNVSGRAFRLD